MEQIITKQKLGELAKFKGDIRGDGILSYSEFILKEEGQDGLTALQKSLEGLGYSIDKKSIKRMDFYPISAWTAILLSMQRLFGYDDDRFQGLGVFHVKNSLFIRMFMKYFFSIDEAVARIPKIWRQYFNIGEIELLDFNKDKKYISFKVKKFPIHPICYTVILGVFRGSLELIINGKVVAKKIKCNNKDAGYHEFSLEW